jgi:hypothetical protein
MIESSGTGAIKRYLLLNFKSPRTVNFRGDWLQNTNWVGATGLGSNKSAQSTPFPDQDTYKKQKKKWNIYPRPFSEFLIVAKAFSTEVQVLNSDKRSSGKIKINEAQARTRTASYFFLFWKSALGETFWASWEECFSKRYGLRNRFR